MAQTPQNWNKKLLKLFNIRMTVILLTKNQGIGEFLAPPLRNFGMIWLRDQILEQVSITPSILNLLLDVLPDSKFMDDELAEEISERLFIERCYYNFFKCVN